jgi:hypothetical protein
MREAVAQLESEYPGQSTFVSFSAENKDRGDYYSAGIGYHTATGTTLASALATVRSKELRSIRDLKEEAARLGYELKEVGK